MKKLYLILIVAVCTAVLPLTAMAAPKAVPAEPVFQFVPVPEGQNLSHDFIIRNEGDAPLNITDVIPP